MGASIKDLLGDNIPEAIKDIKHEVKLRDVYKLDMTKADGVYIANSTTKSLSKYFVVVGFDAKGNVYGGLLISSNLPKKVTDHTVKYEQCYIRACDNDFLSYDSYINCSRIFQMIPDKFTSTTYSGCLDNQSFYSVTRMLLSSNNESITDAERKIFNIKDHTQSQF